MELATALVRGSWSSKKSVADSRSVTSRSSRSRMVDSLVWIGVMFVDRSDGVVVRCFWLRL